MNGKVILVEWTYVLANSAKTAYLAESPMFPGACLLLQVE